MRRAEWALVGILVAVAAGRLLVGAGSLADAQLSATFLALRGTQVGVAALAGAALAVAGCLAQALFRNPLAEPGVLGISAGAMLGAQLCLLALARFGSSLPAELVLPAGCGAGALLVLMLLLTVQARLGEGLSVLLAGVVAGLACGAVSGLLLAWTGSDWQLARAMARLGQGDISGKGLAHLALAAPLVLASLLAACNHARGCDLLLSGSEEAQALGLEVATTRRWLVIWCAVLVAAAAVIGGSLPFVGLVVPHLLRGWVGVGHRRLLPLAALGGAALAIAADLLAQLLHPNGVLPLGAVCGALGAPVFVALLLRRGYGALR